jgi:tetratricopeptide (TPR) repeat protein
MMVKNEEANLPACLESAAALVDEIIVIDTGSTDRTKDIAASFGAKVFEFAWVDSFAAARNAGLDQATGDWIFWLDADDRIDEENRQKLRWLFAQLGEENAAYVMKCRCLPEPETGVATLVDHVRLFRRRPDVRWKYRVHEQILPAVRQAGGEVRATDIVIQHAGYLDAALRQKKMERDLRLLLLDYAQDPEEPFTLFNLGWAYEAAGRPAEALPLLQASLARSHAGDSIVRKLYPLLAACHRRLGQPDEALAACHEGRRFYPDDEQLLYLEAELLHAGKDHAAAEACLLQLLGGAEAPHFASVAEGLRGFKARHLLAVVYRDQGRSAEAEAHWQAAVGEAPGFVPAWAGLGELCLARGRVDDLDRLLAAWEVADPVGGCESVAVAVLRARGLLARRDFAAARALVETALKHRPTEALLWVVLSHALLQEGRDPDAAERALRKILELDPADGEARTNLAILRRQQGQAA